uniref:Secreted protein n=1 Tax=Streptomyces sp. NBC_00049 TaxID=2903617 RepID=A0AAU2K2H3_9ACTN
MDASGNGRHIRPRWSRVRAATLLCAAAALAAATLPASAQPRAVSAPAPDPVVVDCFSKAQVRPDEYLLACGDGNNRLVGLHWDTWGPKTATATGTDMVNDCRPYCAAGRFRPYPVTVTLSSPQPWPDHPDVQRFTMIRLLYTDTAPAPVPKDVSYKLVY